MGGLVRAYWWRGRPNWGDLLTAPLLAHFCGKQVEWAPADQADLVGVGSVIEHLPDSFRGQVLGTGKMFDRSPFPVGADVLALRGPLTAKGLRGDFALGDLGLLANELVLVDTKRHDLGIVPHWSDRQLALDERFTRYRHVVVDAADDPLAIIRTIGECRKVVTSSLHGMILADAFGIPRRFEAAPQLASEGALFKHRDYSAAIRTPLEVGKTIAGKRNWIDDCKTSLYDCLRAL